MDKQPQNSKKPNQYNSYIKYSGLGIQMVVTIYLGNLLGGYLDERYNPDSDLYTSLLTLIAVFLSTFMIIRQVTAGAKNDE